MVIFDKLKIDSKAVISTEEYIMVEGFTEKVWAVKPWGMNTILVTGLMGGY